MTRIVFIHCNAAEAETKSELIRGLGYEVSAIRRLEFATMQAFREDPPDVFLIDLSRQPSQGRDLGIWLRGKRTTRGVPLVFVGGEPAKVQTVRDLLPDATYADWKGIKAALAGALAHPPAKPVAPGAMAGYRGTPLPKKLGIKNGSIMTLLGAPGDFDAKLGKLPSGVEIRRGADRPADIVLLFVRSRADLSREFPIASGSLADGGRLWIVWPKKASGIKSDIGQLEVRAHGLARGFVDYKISAIDATWSGLCFARRGSETR